MAGAEAICASCRSSHHRKFAEIAQASGRGLVPLDDRQHAEWLRGHSRSGDRAEVAADIAAKIKSVLNREGFSWHWWEMLIHQPLVDPELEAVRERCARLDTTSEGCDLLLEELLRLRSVADPRP